MDTDAAAVLDFWFAGQPNQSRAEWFRKDPRFDQEIESRFSGVYRHAREGKLESWKDEPLSALALILVFDQFPRNMFRNSPRAFEADPSAREVSEILVARGDDRLLTPLQRVFAYLPFEHSERLEDQERSVRLFTQLTKDLTNRTFLDYAVQHRDIIARFGRFPHRNAALGRLSTDAEIDFLKTHSGF